MKWYRYPEEIQRAIDIWEPYLKPGMKIEDAPKEVQEAFEKYKKWVWEQGQ